MSHSRLSAHVPAPRSRSHAIRASILGLTTILAAACRADSVTMPGQQDAAGCTTDPGCRPSRSTPVDPVVFAAIADARERLLPMLDDAAARGSLDRALQSLTQALEANKNTDARAELAQVYVQLDKLRIAVEGSAPVDLPDVAAIRLALVPVANALGVQAL